MQLKTHFSHTTGFYSDPSPHPTQGTGLQRERGGEEDLTFRAQFAPIAGSGTVTGGVAIQEKADPPIFTGMVATGSLSVQLDALAPQKPRL